MNNKKRLRLYSKEIASVSNVSEEKSQEQPKKLLTRCKDVSMEIMMDCVCDENYSSLVVSGMPTEEEIADAWLTLCYEYNDIIDNPKSKYRNRLKAEIRFQRIKIDLATGWVKQLALYFSYDIANALQIIGFDISLDPNSPDLQEEIKMIHAELMAMRFDQRIKEAEYNGLKINVNESEKIDRKVFYNLFDRINDLRKREVVSEKSSAMQFAIALNRYYDSITENKIIAHG